MNNYEYNRDAIITNKQTVSVVSVATIKQKLAIQSTDNQFDALLGLYLLDAIDRVEKYTEVFLSERDIELNFQQWDGLLNLMGNNISNLTVKDADDIPVQHERKSKSQINISTNSPFTVKYTCGSNTCDYIFVTAIQNIVDILFYVKEKDEQEQKIQASLKPLYRYVKAYRRL